NIEICLIGYAIPLFQISARRREECRLTLWCAVMHHNNPVIVDETKGHLHIPAGTFVFMPGIDKDDVKSKSLRSNLVYAFRNVAIGTAIVDWRAVSPVIRSKI